VARAPGRPDGLCSPTEGTADTPIAGLPGPGRILLRYDFLICYGRVICVLMSPCGPNAIEWRKSSYSVNNGACVEVMAELDGIAMRDSANKSGSVIRYSSSAWRDFLVQLKGNGLGSAVESVLLL
jgi:hypothetical protein